MKPVIYNEVDITNLKFLPIDVYKSDEYDCTLDGISKEHKLYIAHPEGIWSAQELSEMDNVALVELTQGNSYNGRPNPIIKEIGETRWCMFGGNFGWSCDSRVSSLMPHGPLKIHDRIECK